MFDGLALSSMGSVHYYQRLSPYLQRLKQVLKVCCPDWPL